MLKNLRTPFVVVGLGTSGRAAYQLLLAMGFDKRDISTFDDKDLTADFSDPGTMLTMVKPQTLIVSPGYPLRTNWIQEFEKGGGFVSSEIELAFNCLTSERTIAVTGSIGKSTTVSLLEAGLKSFSNSFFVGGNLGIPLAKYSAEVLSNKRARADWVVVELSSYQLENFDSLEVDFSAITYLTPNHLERYDSLESYYSTKIELIRKTKFTAVLNKNGGDLQNFVNGLKFDCSVEFTYRNDAVMEQLGITSCSLVGSHNLDNLAMAIRLGKLALWPPSATTGMVSYQGLPHRLENLGSRSQIQFINDSKATTVESVIQALKSLESDLKPNNRIVLLLGGKDKNLPWENLAFLKSKPQITVLTFGQSHQLILEKSGIVAESFLTMKDCLGGLKSRLKQNDLVLLSPGGTSLDEFKSFEHRGDVFRDWVNQNFRTEN